MAGRREGKGPKLQAPFLYSNDINGPWEKAPWLRWSVLLYPRHGSQGVHLVSHNISFRVTCTQCHVITIISFKECYQTWCFISVIRHGGFINAVWLLKGYCQILLWLLPIGFQRVHWPSPAGHFNISLKTLLPMEAFEARICQSASRWCERKWNEGVLCGMWIVTHVPARVLSPTKLSSVRKLTWCSRCSRLSNISHGHWAEKPEPITPFQQKMQRTVTLRKKCIN